MKAHTKTKKHYNNVKNNLNEPEPSNDEKLKIVAENETRHFCAGSSKNCKSLM
jgi:hypothetical protein